MKIIFHARYLNVMTGVAKYIITRANYLVARGHEVYILCNEPFDKAGFTVEPIDSRVTVVDYNDLMHREKPAFTTRLKLKIDQFRYLWAIDRFIARVKPDFLITHNDQWCREFFILPHHGAKFIAEWCSTIDKNEVPFEYNRKWWLKWMSWNVDRYVFLVKHDLEIFPGPKKKAMVIPTAVDPSPECSPLTSKVVVSTGRLVPIKNFQALIRAWSQVAMRHPDWQLHIYGEGWLQDELQQLIGDLGLGGKVILKGRTDNVHSVLLRASIFALATLGEGFSISILEAIAHGLPLVVTDIHCTHDLMENCEIGHRVPQGDIDGFAASLNHLIEDESARRRMGQNAHRRSFDYARTKIFAEHETLYRQLISRK